MKTSILKAGEFDMAALRKSRASSKAKVDLLAGLREISPEIEALKVGETAQIEGVAKADNRKVVMSITAKLSHLCSRGGDWAGRKYDVASDSDSGIVYVQRQQGVKPAEAPIRKKGGGGGRKPKAAAQTPATTANEGETQQEQTPATEAPAQVREHA